MYQPYKFDVRSGTITLVTGNNYVYIGKIGYFWSLYPWAEASGLTNILRFEDVTSDTSDIAYRWYGIPLRCLAD